MKKLSLFAVLLALLVSACGLLPSALTDEDIAQYIAAYNNIAKVSPQLEEQRARDGAKSVYTCAECRKTLEKAVQEAGYEDLTAFTLMDVRIHVGMYYFQQIALATLVSGFAAEGVDPEVFCASPEQIARAEDPAAVREQCEKIKLWGGFLQRVVAFTNGVGNKLLQEGDIGKIAAHIDAIVKALTNPDLIDEFSHVRGGGFDD